MIARLLIAWLLILLACFSSTQGVATHEVLCQKHLAERGYGYYPVPNTCNMFVLCSYSQNMTQYCPSGTFWSTVINSCQQVEWVTCPYDPCKPFPDGFMYLDIDSCTHYYKCLGGRSRHAKCPAGEAFDKTISKCVPSRDCARPVKDCNTNKKPSHNPNKFYSGSDSVGWSLMTCPDDLVYSPETCRCTYIKTTTRSAVLDSGCVNDFFFDYNGTLRESQDRVHQSALGSVNVGRDKAIFNGGGSLEIPSLANSDFRPEFALSYKFRLTAPYTKWAKRMALVGNGCNGTKGTLRMYVVGTAVVLEVVATNGANVETFERKVNAVDIYKETTVHLSRSESVIQFLVDGREANPIYTHMYIRPITCPLAIGMGNGLDNFIGEFDDLLFYRCIPDGFAVQ